MPNVLVTGGNRGLGLETSRELAARGFFVWLAARKLAEGEEAAKALGARVRAVELDLESPGGEARLAERLSGEPPLDALVNNAGASLNGFDAEVARRTVDINYRGALRVTEALRPRLAPNANIVMVSSGMGELSHVSPELAEKFRDPALDRQKLEALLDDFLKRVAGGGANLGGWPKNAYSVSKVAMNAFTRILARELPAGQRVNAVCPGWVRTRMGGSSAARSVEQGASGIVWAATLPSNGPNGGFFRDSKAIDW